jgi:hypothetical protein
MPYRAQIVGLFMRASISRQLKPALGRLTDENLRSRRPPICMSLVEIVTARLIPVTTQSRLGLKRNLLICRFAIFESSV